ncbi:hypothetical protein Bca101_016677 [Brassica carinata]
MQVRLGYDPVEDQYKVLCVMARFHYERQDLPLEHFVCTVSSSQKQEWRKIENPTGDNYQRFVYKETCIDGALYYGIGHSTIVIRFDVRSEKIDFIRTPKESITYRSTLINYKGKLGGVDSSCEENLMWLLEDAERQEWSNMKCVLPSSTCEDLLGVHVVTQGVIHTGFCGIHLEGAMEDSQPSLVQAGNNTTTTTTTIPFDLIIEILSLLPAKSLLRFQSVSKLWFSTIRSKFFLDLFQTRSKTRPRLLFNLYHRDSRKKFIFSAPEHTDDDKSSSSSVMARYDMPISAPRYNVLYGSVNGFFCFRGVSSHTITVYNPTTRQVVKLPDAKPKGRHMTALLGYDPVEDQYKVLCVVMREGQDIPQEHLVCTVSSSHDEKQEWRKIENPTGDYYHNICGDICIDGALCYGVSQSRILLNVSRSDPYGRAYGVQGIVGLI